MPIGIVGSWLVLGLLIGFIASKIIKTSDDPGLGIGVAAGGALLIALIYSWHAGAPVGAFSLSVLISAAVGAIAAAIIWHVVRSRFVSHEAYTTRRSY